MKICHLIDTLAMGGAERVAAVHAVELSKRGHEVTLLAYHAGDNLANQLAGSSVRVEIAAAGKAERRQALRRILLGGQFDLVHAYKVPGAIWGMLAYGFTPLPAWFVGQHALSSDSFAVRQLGHALRARFDGWIVPSRAAANTVRSDYGVGDEEIHVLPNPVELNTFTRTQTSEAAKSAMGFSPHTPIVSIVANLHPWKNHGMFLGVAKRVIESGIRAIFLVIGRDQLGGAVQRQCSSMRLDESVIFLGHREDVPRLLEATDIVAITSPQESFCLALAEAGAMGVPTVSTDNGGAREVIVAGETGIIVPNGDESAMAEALIGLLQDKPRRTALGEAARRHVTTRFAPGTIANQLEALYMRSVEAVRG